MNKRLIKEILLEQKEEIEAIPKKEHIIDREQLPEVDKFIDESIIKVITGVRRSGKSVFAYQLLKKRDYAYINFDDERFLGITKEELNNFIEVAKEINPTFKYLLLDEIQNINGWELFVNRLQRVGYNVVITGSNAKLLSKELASHLTGRYIDIEIFPFSFYEFLVYHSERFSADDFYLTEKRGIIKKFLNDYVLVGGFPEILKSKEMAKSYLNNLYSSIIMRDVVIRNKVKYVKALREIALYLISNFSSRISYNKIKNTFHIGSLHTVKNYVSYLADAYLIFQLSPFSYKVKNHLMQPKKVYAIDMGIANVIIPSFSQNYGRIMENLVFLELLRRRYREIYFYLDAQHYEVDFVIKQGLNIAQLIQVSYNVDDPDIKKREIRALLKASKELRCNEMLVITDDYENVEEVKREQIKFLPLWKWLILRPPGTGHKGFVEVK